MGIEEIGKLKDIIRINISGSRSTSSSGMKRGRKVENV